ncbi:MAG: DUF4249 domain-containing protein [Bacteroidales bacterium]|nr:DUF4249 domain-containing protein [Bacteroidales bacterium]
MKLPSRYIAFLSAFAALLLLVSCDSMVSEVEAPQSEPKLVVSGFLNPKDDTIAIRVWKSRPLYTPTSFQSDSYEKVNNATVSLSDGSNTVTPGFDPQLGYYIVPAAAFPLQASTTYSLEVNTPDGYHVTSSCTIPSDEIPDIEITNIETVNEFEMISKRVSLRFRDLDGNGNFYHIAAGTIYAYEYGYDDYFSETGFERGDPYVSDKNKEGAYFTYKTYDIYSYEGGNNKLYISLQNTDEHYYTFHHALRQANYSDGNPFAEPFPLYTNINGGLGIFAAFNGRIIAIELPE